MVSGRLRDAILAPLSPPHSRARRTQGDSECDCKMYCIETQQARPTSLITPGQGCYLPILLTGPPATHEARTAELRTRTTPSASAPHFRPPEDPPGATATWKERHSPKEPSCASVKQWPHLLVSHRRRFPAKALACGKLFRPVYKARSQSQPLAGICRLVKGGVVVHRALRLAFL